MNSDTDRNKNNNLFQMINLVHVASVNRELNKVVRKWDRVGVGAEEKSEYDLRREEYFRDMYTSSADRGHESFFWFELQQYDPMKLRMIHMEPFDKAYSHQYEILPTDIIREIAKTPVNPDNIVTRENVRSDVMDKTVDLKFVRFSETHIFGTVKDRDTETADTGEALGNVYRDRDMGTSFAAFLNYRNKYPGPVLEFVKEFAGGVLPDLVEKGWKPGAEPEGVVRVPDPELTFVSAEGLSGPGEDRNVVTLYDLIALSKNPLYNRLLWLKVAELENGLLKDDILAFEEKKQYYYDKLPRCLGRGSVSENGTPGPYWFVLTRFAPGDWGMTKIDPWPPAFGHFKEVLPPSLFGWLMDTPVDPDTVVEASFRLSYPLDRRLDILWVRYSPFCVMGVVRERLDEWKHLLTEEKDLLEASPGLKGAVYYNLLFDLFRRDEGVAKTFITRFMTELMPQLKEKEKHIPTGYEHTSY